MGFLVFCAPCSYYISKVRTFVLYLGVVKGGPICDTERLGIEDTLAPRLHKVADSDEDDLTEDEEEGKEPALSYAVPLLGNTTVARVQLRQLTLHDIFKPGRKRQTEENIGYDGESVY